MIVSCCRYVVDAGRSKQKLLENNTGGAVARYAVDWISKAAAEQRAGRAGRTGPGHVYRLYSSAHFNDSFKQHTDPEIANTSLEGVVLLLKAMGVDKVGPEHLDWSLYLLLTCVHCGKTSFCCAAAPAVCTGRYTSLLHALASLCCLLHYAARLVGIAL